MRDPFEGLSHGQFGGKLGCRLLKALAHVGQGYHQRHRLNWRGLKAEIEVKSPGIIRDRMHDNNGTDPNGFGGI
jgi:hypothetical protein